MTSSTNQDLIALAVSNYSHVLEYNKQYSFSQFAYQISKVYDLSTPQTKAVYDQLKATKGQIKKTYRGIRYTV